MVEGMLAESWVLRGYQEARLREFLELLPSAGPRCRHGDLAVGRTVATGQLNAITVSPWLALSGRPERIGALRDAEGELSTAQIVTALLEAGGQRGER